MSKWEPTSFRVFRLVSHFREPTSGLEPLTFDGVDEDGLEERSSAYQHLMRDLLDAQRATLLQLRNEGRISDDVMHRIEHDLDLEETRLEM